MWGSVEYTSVSVVWCRKLHDALTPEELDVWSTPEGILSTEKAQEGVYKGEVRGFPL